MDIQGEVLEVTLIEELSGAWSLNLAPFTVPLQRGMQVIVAPGTVLKKADGSSEPSSAEIRCHIVDWRYRIASAEQTGLELIVRTDCPPAAENPKAQERKFWGAIVLGQFTLLLVAIFWYNTHLSPDWGWAIVGRHIRWVVGLGILTLFSAVLPWRLGLNSSENFGKRYINVLSLLTGFVLVAVWASISRRPQPFTVSDQGYADYARALIGKLSGTYWPVLLAALPWLAVAFKAFRFENAERTADALIKAAER